VRAERNYGLEGHDGAIPTGDAIPPPEIEA